MLFARRFGAFVAMNWVRSRARKLSLLALFALAMQFGLSFGHVHAGAYGGPVSAKTALANPSSPASDNDQDNGNDGCAICATIAMANTLIDSVPPVLPLPAQIHTAPVVVAVLRDATQPQRLSFQSRAPPRS